MTIHRAASKHHLLADSRLRARRSLPSTKDYSWRVLQRRPAIWRLRSACALRLAEAEPEALLLHGNPLSTDVNRDWPLSLPLGLAAVCIYNSFCDEDVEEVAVAAYRS